MFTNSHIAVGRGGGLILISKGICTKSDYNETYKKWNSAFRLAIPSHYILHPPHIQAYSTWLLSSGHLSRYCTNSTLLTFGYRTGTGV